MMANQNFTHIETHRGCRPYNRMIFGQFLEHFHRQVYGGVFEPGSPLADAKGFRLDVIAALRELRVPIVRWPGGCFVSAYHWARGIGHDRQPSYDKAWRVEEPNTFGTDEFIEWCRLIGAEPYICTNAGTGSPEEMSDWVEYCNLDIGRWGRLRQANGYVKPHQVCYWSIGNENYGSWEMGAKTKEEWGRFVAESAKMMKRVDPSIKLLAAALPDVDWTLNLLKQAGQYLDCVSIHGYWDPLWQKDEPSDYATCMTRALEPEVAIRTTEQIIGVAGFEGQIGIAFDEWNLRGWHHPDGNSMRAIGARDRNDINATYTMADAVFSAGFLNACLRHPSVTMANMAPVINARGPLFVHPKGIIKRATFHVLAMYANLLEEYVAQNWTSCEMFTHDGNSVPALDVVATCDAARERWAIAAVNRHPLVSIRSHIAFEGKSLTGTHQMTTLSGDSPDACNDVDHPERVVPVTKDVCVEQGMVDFPPHSVNIVKF
ncbi:alpha-N-arabinofuranosidase [Candidatus Moduliflexus flocculans]|uniref:non-reducing end alpha-L-arabinofuranosidase n=1 Tax=Candidatus Moduliflexus flocculans TaxID=1499966 RepID=A0A081BS79_9BACT|nr:alpha-N-arabinofuranosidase [Candidatus Moduliflexus flocculans]